MKKLIFFLVSFLIFTPVFGSEGNLSISPAKNELVVIAGQTLEQSLMIFNETSAPLTLKLESADFLPEVALSSASPIKFSLDGDNPYSLRHYLNFNHEPFQIAPGERVNIPVLITPPKNLSAGGYYGVVFVKTVPVVGEQNGAKVEARLGSLFFVTIPGPVIKQGELKDFGLIGNKILWHKKDLPLQIYYENSGTIHLNPYGQISLTDSFGTVNNLFVDPWFVLPQSGRLREITLPSLKNFWPGKYQVKLELNRGYDDIIEVKEFSFWYLPWWVVLVLVLLLLFIFKIIKKLVFKIILIIILLALAGSTFAYVASSTNYRIQSDSLNFAGGNSTSTNYEIESSLGEIATGVGTSTNYQIKAGYQQMLVSSISITSPADITLAPALTAVGSATGEASWTVITDNPAGYTLAVNSSVSPAFVSSSDSFANYTPSGAIPDYSWSVGSSASEFGYTVEGADTATRFKDDGVACNTGILNNTNTCWDTFSTSPVTIASRSNSNTPSGTATTIKLQAEIGSSATPVTGTYSATLTLTATAL